MESCSLHFIRSAFIILPADAFEPVSFVVVSSASAVSQPSFRQAYRYGIIRTRIQE